MKRAKSRSVDKKANRATVDLDDLAGQLSDAMVFVEVAVLSLDAHEGRGGCELRVLEHGLKELERAHAARWTGEP